MLKQLQTKAIDGFNITFTLESNISNRVERTGSLLVGHLKLEPSPPRTELCPLCHFKCVAGKFTLQLAPVPLGRYSCCTRPVKWNRSCDTQSRPTGHAADSDAERGDNDEVADRVIERSSTQKSSRSQDLEGQATVKPFLMFVFEFVSGGNDCTRGVDPDGLSAGSASAA